MLPEGEENMLSKENFQGFRPRNKLEKFTSLPNERKKNEWFGLDTKDVDFIKSYKEINFDKISKVISKWVDC